MSIYKPLVWGMVWLFLVMILLSYPIADIIYDKYRYRIPWRKNSEHHESYEAMIIERMDILNTRSIIDKSIITICVFVVMWVVLWLGFNKPNVLVLLGLAVALYFATELIYDTVKDILPWRKNNEERHE